MSSTKNNRIKRLIARVAAKPERITSARERMAESMWWHGALSPNQAKI